MQQNQASNQQGFLQYLHNNTVQKVFVVLNRNRLLCYLDDPSKSSVRLTPIHSIDLATSKIIESGPNLARPKSFQFTSSDGVNIGEFVCPTNSIKLQWVKSIMEYSTGGSLGDSGRMDDHQRNPLILAPKPFTSRSASPTKALSVSTNGQGFADIAPPASSLSSSSGPRQLGHLSAALHLGHRPAAATLPNWVPNTFGNHDIKSRKVSPQRTGNSNSAFTDLDKVTIHRHHNRSVSPPATAAATQLGSSRHSDAGYTSQESRGGGGGRSSHHRMEDMTVGELREALRSIPAHLRSDLLQSDHSDVEHQRQQRHRFGDSRGSNHLQSSGEFDGRNSGRSQSAGHSGRGHHQHDHRGSEERYERNSDGRHQKERARSAGPNYMRQTEQSHHHIRSSASKGDGRAVDRDSNIFYYDESEPRRNSHYGRSQSPPQHRSGDSHGRHHQSGGKGGGHAEESDRIVLDVVYRHSEDERGVYSGGENHHSSSSRRRDRHDHHRENDYGLHDHGSEDSEQEGEQSDHSYESERDFFETPQQQSRHHQQHRSSRVGTLESGGSAKKYQTPVNPSHAQSRSAARAKSTSPVRGRSELSNSAELKQRSASAHHDSRHGSGVVTTEAERKSALEWSRRNAQDKQYRTDYPASPIHGSSSSNLLKFKYQSFNNSLERDDGHAGVESTGANSPGAAANRRLGSSLERKSSDLTASREKTLPSYMGSKHKEPHSSSGSGGQIKGASNSGFNAFLNSRKSLPTSGTAAASSSSSAAARPVVPPSHPPPSGAAIDPLAKANQDLLARYRSKQPPPAPGDIPAPVVRKSSKKQLLTSEHHPAASTAQQLLVGKPPSLTNPSKTVSAPPAAQSFRKPPPVSNAFDDLSSIDQEISRIRSYSTDLEFGGDRGGDMTDVAEWRRLTDWLKRNEFEKYIRSFRENGVTKLSIVELLTQEDMSQIGIEPADRERMLKKVSEFTRRTRTFSEQVLSPQKSPDVDRVSSSEQQQTHNKRSSGSTRIDPAVRTSSKPKHVNPYASRVYNNKSDIRRDLIASFDSGNHDLFFHAWKTAILAHFPPDYAELNPSRPTQYQTKQVMEFHLYLYFSVYPIMNQLDKDQIKSGKNCLKEYLETMLVTSEVDSWGAGLLDASIGSAAAAVPNHTSSPPETALTSPTLRSAGGTTYSTSAFMRSKEFAVYAGLVMVPEPQTNEAFAQLFKQDWMAAMRSRLLQFLDIVGFSESVVSINLSEQLDAAADEPELAQPTFSAPMVGDPMVTPKVTPRASYSNLKPAHVVIDTATTPKAAALAASGGGLSKSQQSAKLLQESQQVTDTIAADDLGPPIAAAAAPVPNTDVVSLPRRGSTGLPANALSPISPARRFSKGAAALAAAGGAGGGADQLTSPLSTGSTISQLTDDDGEGNDEQAPVGGVRNGAVNKNLSKSYPAAGAAGGTGAAGKSASGHRVGKNPLSKSVMQQQVNEYNKLLRSGGAGAVAANRPSISSLSQAVTVTAAEAAVSTENAAVGSASEGEDQVDGNNGGSKTRTSLVVGGNVKPRLAPAAPAGAPPAAVAGPAVKIVSGNRESMQSQVNVYTKLLKQKQAARRSSETALNSSSEAAVVEVNGSKTEENGATTETSEPLPAMVEAHASEKRQSIVVNQEIPHDDAPVVQAEDVVASEVVASNESE